MTTTKMNANANVKNSNNVLHATHAAMTNVIADCDCCFDSDLKKKKKMIWDDLDFLTMLPPSGEYVKHAHRNPSLGQLHPAECRTQPAGEVEWIPRAFLSSKTMTTMRRMQRKGEVDDNSSPEDATEMRTKTKNKMMIVAVEMENWIGCEVDDDDDEPVMMMT